MAGFKTHITTSTVVGLVYGYWGVTDQGMSLESGLLAGGLCSVSGMLPDLDSDSGVPLRETTMFISAIAPMLMIERWRDMGLTHESMALAAMLIYVAIRFVAVEFFRRFTVHRGMWHSIPAAFIAMMIAYLLMPCPSEAVRVYKSLAVFIGFMTHLILDEIWSIDLSRGRIRTKKSFGTALKFFGNVWWVNISVYAKLALLVYLSQGDHAILDRLRQRVRLDREQYAIPDSTPYAASTTPWQSNESTPTGNARPPEYAPYENMPYQNSPANQFAPQSQPWTPQPSEPQPWQPPSQNWSQSEPTGNRIAVPRPPALPY